MRVVSLLSGMVLGAVALAAPARAEVHAILVGVSQYRHLTPDLHLRGAANDAREMARWLLESGVPAANIRLLADNAGEVPAGLGAPVEPTKAAIVAAFDEVTAAVAPGDLVVFHFSGHGSQQRDLSGDEGGGSDEIFMPIDSGRWDTATGLMQNALVDDELDFLTARIRNAGADIWAVIDACHSSTGFRGAGDGAGPMRTRFIPPAVLDPDGAMELATPDGRVADGDLEGLATLPLKADAGRLAVFYSAQEHQRAGEKPLPDEATGAWHGLFSFHMLQRLRTASGASYRQLFQSVVDDLRAAGVAAAQTPDYEGDMLDEPILKGEAAVARQWAASGTGVSAGYLHGLAPGSIVALVADPAAPPEAALGHAQITTVEALQAGYRAVDYPCALRDAEGFCPPSASPVAGDIRYARLVEPALDFVVRIGAPQRIDAADGHDYGAILAAYEAVAGLPPVERGRLQLGASDPDVALALVDGRLAISGPSGVVDPHGPGSSLRLELPADPAEARARLLDAFQRISRVMALYRVSSAQKTPLFGLGGFGKPVRTTLRASKAGPEAAEATTCPKIASRAELDRLAQAAVPVGSPGQLSNCDLLFIDFVNGSPTAQDVTVLYVDGSFGIEPVWPRRGVSNRLAFNQSVSMPIRIRTLRDDGSRAPTGEERIVVLAVPVTDATAERTVLTGLAQPAMTMRTSRSPMEAFIAGAMADTVRTRGGLGRSAQTLVADVHGFVVVPGGGDAVAAEAPAQ